MKNVITLCCLLLLTSCLDLFKKEQNEITYVFINSDNISETEKKLTAKVIKKRLNRLTPKVDVINNSKNEIVVTLNSKFEIERLNTIIENQGKLGFWLCYKQEELWPFLLEANEAGSSDDNKDPLNAMLQGVSNDGLFHILEADITNFKDYFDKAKIKLLFTKDYKDLKFLFGKSSEKFVTVYAVKSNERSRALINETNIVEVRQEYDQIGRPAISMSMNEFGAYNWTKLTNDAYKTESRIAIAINNIVYSAPTVSGGPISGGQSQISGDFTLEEAQNLSYILSSQRSIPKLKFANIKKIENQ